MSAQDDPLQEMFTRTKSNYPWLADAIAGSLRKIPRDHRTERLIEVWSGVLDDIAENTSELSELYVKTPDFGTLCDRIFHYILQERIEDKRHIARCFLADTVTSPCDPLETQMAFIQMMEEIRTDHLRLLHAFTDPPDPYAAGVASPLQVLRKRLPDIPHDRIEGLLSHLADFGMVEKTDWTASRPGIAAGQLTNLITPMGKRVLKFMSRQVNR